MGRTKLTLLGFLALFPLLSAAQQPIPVDERTLNDHVIERVDPSYPPIAKAARVVQAAEKLFGVPGIAVSFWKLIHRISMRGDDQKQAAMFSYLTLAQRIPADHPARQIRALVDRALERMDGELEKLYSDTGRPSIAPERLLRATLLMILYSIRSERQLMEQQITLGAGTQYQEEKFYRGVARAGC